MDLEGSATAFALHLPLLFFLHTVLLHCKPQFPPTQINLPLLHLLFEPDTWLLQDRFSAVRDISKVVFLMPSPKQDDEIQFSCVRNFAEYDASVTVGTDCKQDATWVEGSSSRRSRNIEVPDC